MSDVNPIKRIFSEDKVIESRALNLVGIQVARTLVARLLYRVRPNSADNSIRPQIQQLCREGILVLPSFLPDDQFAAIREEFLYLTHKSDRGKKIHTQGSSVLEITSIAQYSENKIPNIYQFFTNSRLLAILAAAEKRPLQNLWPFGQTEVLTQGQTENSIDPECQLHSDIWFNTHKVWLYLDDVGMEDGPLVYMKGSHRLSALQLYYLYQESWKRDSASNQSRRISDTEADCVGTRESVVTCGRNTLVIANTCGYHRRLQGSAGRKRRALHIFLRDNPFHAHTLRARLKRYPHLYQILRKAKGRLGRVHPAASYAS